MTDPNEAPLKDSSTDRPIRILVLAPQPFFQPRGTPIAMRRVLQVLARRGFHLDIVTYPEGEDVVLENCRIHRLPQLPLVRRIPAGFSWKKLVYDAAMFWKVVRLRAWRHWDLIHASEESVFIALLFNRLFGTPYVYDMDSLLSEQMLDRFTWLRPFVWPMRWFETLAVRSSSGVVSVCKSLEDTVSAVAPHVPVVRMEDVPLLAPGSNPPDDPILDRLDGPLVMYVGNLEWYQGIDLLLHAFVHLFHQHPTARLVLVGGRRGKIQEYRRQAQRLAVASRVHFVGPRPLEELAHCLRRADVLVSPRIAGSNTPMKIFSYMASGRPILATRLDTHLQVLDDDSALLVAPTALEFSRGMLALLDDAQLSEQLAREALRRVQHDFAEQVLDVKLATFYDTLTSSSQPAQAAVADPEPVAEGRQTVTP